MKKLRLDQYVFDHGFISDWERAKTTIMAGDVYVNGQKETKPGALIPSDAKVEVRSNSLPYVSRGGLKLEKAVHVFGLDIWDSVCVDCGASTGGFTDVLLKNGARKVYAVDVGYGLLAWSLRTDPRVICLERTNVRHISREHVPEDVDLCVTDVSFISLKLVLPALYRLLRDDGQVVCLVKPQFEAEKEQVGKKGVVRDPFVHEDVLQNFLSFSSEAGYGLLGLDFSPIRGPEGNIEYLAQLQKNAKDSFRPDLKTLVRDSHDYHRKDSCHG